jgi:hypothetical protein
VSSELWRRLAELPGVEERPSQFHGEPALWVDGREFLHRHGTDLVEIRLTGKGITALDDDRPMRRSRTSDWVMVDVHHVDLILDLARRAIEANRA